MSENPLTFRYRDADLGADAEAKRRLLRTLKNAAQRCFWESDTMEDIASDLHETLQADFGVFIVPQSKRSPL